MTTETTEQKPPVKPIHLAGLSIIVVAILFGSFGFKDAFRSYTTSVVEAKESGRSVQLAGFLGTTGEYDEAGNWTFMLQDENDNQVKVVYSKTRPSNFEQAVSIVAIGRYDIGKDVFLAEDLLVKCPSKYQEQLN
jgi:cytochrome c-type biogenesis protein CcmE